MIEATNLEQILQKIDFLESQLGEVNKKINTLQVENQELRRMATYKNELSNFKRPASEAGLENPSGKKYKYNSELVTPTIKVLQNGKSLSESDAASSQRRQVMKEIVKDFHCNVLPRYQDHLNKERNLLPRLRSYDGKIILKNIRYIR